MLTVLDDALQAGGRAVEGLLATLAHKSAKEGRIHTELLDAWQVELYQLTQAYASLQVANHARMGGARGEPEALLALAFGGRILSTLRGQLGTLALHLPEAGSIGESLAQHEGAIQLIRETTGAAFTEKLWEVLRGAPADGVAGLNEEYRLLHGTFRTFAEKKVRPLAERFHQKNLLIPDELIAEVSQLGCFGSGIPEQYGGFQERPDHLGMVVVTEALSWGALIFGSLITRPEILAKALLKGGTSEQKARFLPAMASGEKMVAVSVTEPDYGSNVADISCSARQVEGGWRIDGTKTFATFAGRAELIGLLARSEPAAVGHRGLSLFVVEKPPFYGEDFEHLSPGGGRLSGRAIPTAGYRGMHSYELNFVDYFIPEDNLVGKEAGRGQGFYLQMEGFAGGRLQTAARALGVMQAAYEHARDYAAVRKVFNKPLEAYPLNREKLVGMAATLQAARQSAYATARLMNEDGGQLEASMTKFLLCRQAEWVTREAQQLHGAMGYAEEFPLARLLIDARVLSIFEGTEEVLALRVIAPGLLKRYL